MLGDRGLGHLHANDNFVDGVFLAIGKDGDDLAATGLGNGGEDVGGMSLSCHEDQYIPYKEYVKS
jgi:hypothetical protein